MTVQEAKVELFNYFSKNKYLKLNNIVQEFLLIDEVEIKKHTFIEAANDLIKIDVIRQINVKENNGLYFEYYVLTKSLEDYEQNVVLSSVTAQTISDIINNYRQDTDQDGYACDPLNVTDKDIQNVIKVLIIKGNLNEQYED